MSTNTSERLVNTVYIGPVEAKTEFARKLLLYALEKPGFFREEGSQFLR
jgi:hypothetical protein